MKKVGRTYTDKAVYFRDTFVDEDGNKKSKWIKVKGVTVAYGATELQVKTSAFNAQYPLDEEKYWNLQDVYGNRSVFQLTLAKKGESE